MDEALEEMWNDIALNDRPLPRRLPRHRYTHERFEYLRGEIEAERISYSEIAELQSLVPYIDPSDVVLLEWAGVPEFPE